MRKIRQGLNQRGKGKSIRERDLDEALNLQGMARRQSVVQHMQYSRRKYTGGVPSGLTRLRRSR